MQTLNDRIFDRGIINRRYVRKVSGGKGNFLMIMLIVLFAWFLKWFLMRPFKDVNTKQSCYITFFAKTKIS